MNVARRRWSLYFNWRDFAAFTRRALRPPPDSPYRLSPKRAAVLAGFFGLFLGTELATRIGFLADDLVYPQYAGICVDAPVFIIGNPRSGTTFLHRLLAQDTDTFTTLRLWEILFAPSILQRQLVRRLSRLDRAIGSPLRHMVARLDRAAAEQNDVHNATLLSPEEDQYMLLHIWSTLAVWHFSGILEEAGPYTHFDRDVPKDEKQQIMAFYRRTIQKHLHADRLKGHPARHYLAKNPSASAKVDTLLSAFPDARFIYLVRTPLEMIPSMISCLDLTWRILGSPAHPHAARDYVLQMAKHWYTHPLDRLAQEPQTRYAIVAFDDLTRQADRTVRSIYARLGLALNDAFADRLSREAEKARTYQSHHHYDLNEMGLSREMILSEFGETFRRFGFDPNR